jgi:hypothetical protein
MKRVFWGVFCYCLAIQLATKGQTDFIDKTMWANQIVWYLNQDPRVFDFNAAYGHPGGTLVGLGSLLYRYCGLSSSVALSVSMSLYIAAATAACSVLCLRLRPQTLWWLAAAFILTFNRIYIFSTPPTATVLPLITLMVLSTWWLWQENTSRPQWIYFAWGAIGGLAAATRLDITLLLGAAMFPLVCYRGRLRALPPMLAGASLAFFAADPFLWFMPLQHLKDLLHKFTYHYAQFQSKDTIRLTEYLYALPLTVASMVWGGVLLARRRLERLMPLPLFVGFSAATVLATALILTSDFQAVRYFYPLIMVWEILLALFALEHFAPAGTAAELPQAPDRRNLAAWVVILALVLIQLLAYLLCLADG